MTTSEHPLANRRSLLSVRLRTSAAALVALSALGGCASVTFTSAGRAPALAAADRTFALLVPETAPAGFHATSATPTIWARVAPLVRARMVADGFVERPATDARLLVRFGAGVQPHNEEVIGGGPGNDVGIDLPEYTDAALVLDVTDRAAGRRVWRGGAYAEIDPGHVDTAQLERSVDGLVDRFANASRASGGR